MDDLSFSVEMSHKTALGDTEAEGLTDGEMDSLGDNEADGLTEELSLKPDGDIEEDGDNDGLSLGDSEADGDIDADGLSDGETDDELSTSSWTVKLST